MKRLQGKKSSMDVIKWEIERRRQEKMLDKMCYHPHIFKVDQPDLLQPSLIQPPMSLSKNDYTPLSKIEEVPSLPKIKHNHENASGRKKKASTHHGAKSHN